eukprot:8756675-Alexandrium_andersonii.AAC.1
MVHGPTRCHAVGPALIMEHAPAHQPATHFAGCERLEAQRALCAFEGCIAPSCPDLLAGTPWVPQCVQQMQVSLHWVATFENLRGSLKRQRIECL